MDYYNLNYDLGASRFILLTDPQCSELLYPIPNLWWSRFFEYKWASLFPDKDDVCLDAGCGVVNHFKFYLASICKEAHGCDIDINIENKTLIEDSFKRDLDNSYYINFKPALDKVILKNADLSNLPYDDNYFDKIYGISIVNSIDGTILEKVFMEFNRILKDDGLLILTFDYPAVDLNNFQLLLENTGFSFAFEPDFNVYASVIQTNLYPGITCFRAVLIKNDDLIIHSAEIIE